MTDLSSTDRGVMLHGLQKVALVMANTLLPDDGDTILTKLMETNVGDGLVTNAVVKGVKVSSRAALENRVLKALLFT